MAFDEVAINEPLSLRRTILPESTPTRVPLNDINRLNPEGVMASGGRTAAVTVIPA